ncbi:MAG: aminoglycoside adenylyltransferase domain-containing protein [Bacillota bacterium]
MKPTPYPSINILLQSLFTDIHEVLGDKLVGLYLYGSLAWGDFDYEISDIDLLAAVSSEINEDELQTLQKMHAGFAKRNKEWDNRIEVQYYPTDALKTFKIKPSKMAVISPGEPLHIVEAGIQWLTNWYFVQDYGITLFGPAPTTFIEPISKEEFIEAIEKQALGWRDYVKNTIHSRSYQGYAILTICRAFYTLKHGEQVSKIKAARWFKKEIPEYAWLIENAIIWRQDYRNENINHEETYLETVEFVRFVIDRISNRKY